MTPNLRFPEFRDTVEWLETPLDKISNRIVEKVGDANLIPVSITAGQGFVSQVEKFGRDISGVQYKNYILLHKGDFAYNKGNSKSYPQGCVRRLKEFEQAAVPSAFVSFRLNDGYVPEFFEGLFEKNTHGQQLIKFISSSARSDGLLNISPAEFFSIKLPVPQTLGEQEKIADCLSSLDGLIAAEGQKLEALRDHKRGLMQQLFPRPGETQPRLRFQEFKEAGEWEEKTLPELAENLDNKRIPIKESNRINGDVPYYGASGIVDYVRDYLFDEDLLCISEDGANLVARTYPIAFPISGKTWVNNHAHVLRFDKPATQKMVEDYFNFMDLNDFITGMAQPKLNRTMLDTIPIPLPGQEEQQRIAECLSALDAMIARQAGMIDALKAHKRGLMQRLFPAPDEQ